MLMELCMIFMKNCEFYAMLKNVLCSKTNIASSVTHLTASP